jgi:predicted  nucleic acid-binding Zn-ribbon protein
MSDENSLKGRVTRQGEEAIGRVAQELLENPMVAGALSRAFETRERAVRAQEVAMGALNLPSASDLERLTRRVRSVSQRLEGIEDALDRLDERAGRADGGAAFEERLARIEASLERLENASASGAQPAGDEPAAPTRP